MLDVPGSFRHLLISYLGRTAIVSLGMMAAGKRKHVLRDAAAGAAMIEAAMLVYFSKKENQTSDTLHTQQNVADLLNGKTDRLLPIAADVAIRTIEILGGMTLVGSKDSKVRYALGGALSVEAFIVAYSILKGRPCPTQP